MKKLFDIIYIEKGPQEVVVVVDRFDPGSLRVETCGTMEVADRRLNYGGVIHIVDGLHQVGTIGIE